MAFLLSMLTLLVTTFFSICFNFDSLNNINLNRDNNNFFYNIILPLELYNKELLLPILLIDVVLCGIFMLGVMLLVYVQTKNFISGLTTAERSAATKRPA